MPTCELDVKEPNEGMDEVIAKCLELEGDLMEEGE